MDDKEKKTHFFEKGEEFLEIFRKGQEFTQEILKENERLLGRLEAELVETPVADEARRRGRAFDVVIEAVGGNGPLSDPPANFIWVRSATLEFYAPAAARGGREPSASPGG